MWRTAQFDPLFGFIPADFYNISSELMGQWLALLSACCFAELNETIMRGAAVEGQHDAFLSILLTAGIAGAIWPAQGGE